MEPHLLAAARRALLATLCLVVALVLWLMRNAAASWAATSMVASAQLVTSTERDDSRVNRAFAAVIERTHEDAVLKPQDPLPATSRVRHSELSLRQPTEAEALAKMHALGSLIAAEYNQQGSGQLTVWERRRAKPFLDEHAVFVKQVVQDSALTAALFGLLLLFLAWRHYRSSPERPPAKLWWPAAVLLGLPLLGPFGLIMLVPTAIAARICYIVIRTRHAARWPTTMARITKSEVRVDHGNLEDVTSVVNVPVVEYEFTVGGKVYNGSRVNAVDDKNNRDVQARLDRYPAGATVPVYYKPDDPAEAVLEHNLPMPAPAMYSIAGGIFMAGVAAAGAFANVAPIMEKLRAIFPPGAEPQFAFFFGLGTLLLAVIQISNQRDARKAASWPTTEGRIVSSKVESFTQRVGGRSGTTARFYQAVVEYAFQVEGREYHSTRLSFGPVESTPKGPAESKAARYPQGREVMVHYDPQNPPNAVLDPRVARNWLGWLIAIVFVGLAVFFSGAFR